MQTTTRIPGGTLLLHSDALRTRLRVRRIDIEAEAASFLASGEPLRVLHGGTVANAYKYPAETEGLVLVSLPELKIVVAWHTRLPANKTTEGGVLAHCIGEDCRAACDSRFSTASALRARRALVELALQAAANLRVAAEAAAAAHGS